MEVASHCSFDLHSETKLQMLLEEITINVLQPEENSHSSRGAEVQRLATLLQEFCKHELRENSPVRDSVLQGRVGGRGGEAAAPTRGSHS